MGGMARFGNRLAELSPKRKLGLMLLFDGLFLPLAAFMAVVLGPSQASDVPAWVYVVAGLMAAAMLWATGFYRTVVRFADLKGVGRGSATLAAAAIAFLLLALPFSAKPPAVSSLVIFWPPPSYRPASRAGAVRVGVTRWSTAPAARAFNWHRRCISAPSTAPCVSSTTAHVCAAAS
jgi:hypothetical protein